MRPVHRARCCLNRGGGSQGAEGAGNNDRAKRRGPDRRKRTGQDQECRVDHLDDHDKKSAHAFCVSSVSLHY